MWLVKTKTPSYSFDTLDNFFDYPIFSKQYETPKLSSSLKETTDSIIVTISVPGIEKKDISLEYDNKMLSVEVNQQISQASTEEATVHLDEFGASTNSRSFYVGDIKENNIEAHLKDGLLTITLPKKDLKKAKQITIR